MNELSRKYKHLQKDKENAEYKINNLAKTVQERDKEIDSLVEEVAMWELATDVKNATDVYMWTRIDPYCHKLVCYFVSILGPIKMLIRREKMPLQMLYKS